MQNILVITDQEQAETTALHKGFELASASGARLDIISFCHANLSGLPTRGSMPPKEIQQLILDKKKIGLESTLSSLRPEFPLLNDREINTEIVWENNIHEWITRRTINQPCDLIIKTGHRSESPIYTPTDWHLMREAPAPVYLVTEHTWKAKKRVLITLDIESKHAEKQQLNLRLLGAGRNIADVLKAELVCCFVVRIPRLLLEFDVIDTSTYTRRAREIFLPRVLEMVKPYGIDPANIYRETGDPGERILRLTNKLKPACVVIGSIGRQGVSGKLIGNTAEQLIKSVHADLLVVNNA